jgi:hydroxymethylbilane synthase
MTTLRIGSRGSDLARWQAEHVAGLLRSVEPGCVIEITIISTTGDRILDAPLAKIGGKGLFTKEIEEALLDGRCDLAVHSLKDLPTELPDGLGLGAVLSRTDPRDALISARRERFGALPAGARIGTSSLRRQAQLLHARPDLRVETLRGNVPTRVRKGISGEFDGVILARAGLERLGLLESVSEVLSFDLLLPAPGQGALGVEIRDSDVRMADLLTRLEDSATRAAADAERAFLHALGGGCQVPVGAHARPRDGDAAWLELDGMVADPGGRTLLRGVKAGRIEEAEGIGAQLAAELIRRGAGAILESVRAAGAEGGAP